MNQALADLLTQLDLEQRSSGVFRGQNPPSWRKRMFGGLVAAQALKAAADGLDMPAHSLHAYFLRAGQPAVPVDYRVERPREGRSFVTRSVSAEQNGQVILQLMASFHRGEPGFEHQEPATPAPAPPPEQCMTWEQWFTPLAQKVGEEPRAHMLRDRPIEIRFIEPMDILNPAPSGAQQRIWLRAAQALPDDTLLHQCVATYASDHTLLSVVMRAHGRTFVSRDINAASLDHAVWFHRPLRIDQWHLYEQVSPAAFNGRGLALGRFYAQDGTLVASVAQEGILRLLAR